MDFYAALAERYDEIFPTAPAVTASIAGELPAGADPRRILDVGCATGGLALALAALGHDVVGLDLDKRMIEIARARAAGLPAAGRIEFRRADMLRLDESFAPGSFALIACLGNTLVHLPDEPAIGAFLVQARRALAPRGVLLLQILNYEYIRRGRVTRLPVIETRNVVFRRAYRDRPDGRLDFCIELFDRGSGESSAATLPLLPLDKDALDRLLDAADFPRRRFYGGFGREPFAPDGLVLVCAAYC